MSKLCPRCQTEYPEGTQSGECNWCPGGVLVKKPSPVAADHGLSASEIEAWELWKKDHPESTEKSWHTLPAWVQSAYLHYVEAE